MLGFVRQVIAEKVISSTVTDFQNACILPGLAGYL
jgi:hypothetical protein